MTDAVELYVICPHCRQPKKKGEPCPCQNAKGMPPGTFVPGAHSDIACTPGPKEEI